MVGASWSDTLCLFLANGVRVAYVSARWKNGASGLVETSQPDFGGNMQAITKLLMIVGLSACGGGSTSADSQARKTKRVVIENKGSDTLVNVAQAWAEAYKDINPSVAIAVTGGGSGTGISSMINGTVDIANSSRKMKEKEIKAAQGNGVEPVEHVVGFDAVAVFLHPDNPLKEVSLDLLAKIYGDGGAFNKWSDLGIEVPGCPSDEIHPGVPPEQQRNLRLFQESGSWKR